jgi:hypothetical protein
MGNLIRALVVGFVFTAGFAGVASAADEAAARAGAPAEVKKGDTVYVCGCGAGCHCGTIQAGPGTCSCGKELVQATVTKIEGGMIHVDRGGKPGETSFKAPYKCGCGPQCSCNTVAFGPGKCHCGKDLVKAN